VRTVDRSFSVIAKQFVAGEVGEVFRAGACQAVEGGPQCSPAVGVALPLRVDEKRIGAAAIFLTATAA